MGAHINTSTKRGAGQYLDLATLRVAYPTRYTPFVKSDHHDIEDSMALPPTNCDVNGQQSAVLGLYTGCPPGRAVHFDAVASYTDAIGRVLDHGCMQPTSVPKYSGKELVTHMRGNWDRFSRTLCPAFGPGTTFTQPSACTIV